MKNNEYIFDELHEGEEYSETISRFLMVTKKETNESIKIYLFNCIKIWEADKIFNLH